MANPNTPPKASTGVSPLVGSVGHVHRHPFLRFRHPKASTDPQLNSAITDRTLLMKTTLHLRSRCLRIVRPFNLPAALAFLLAVAVHSRGECSSGTLAEFAENPPAPVEVIPFDQIGTVAGTGYGGEGLSVRSDGSGAVLRCDFQRLTGRVDEHGLWLQSTKTGADGERLRVTAAALGRERTIPLSAVGEVGVEGPLARFVRPGVIEEYSVSMDGVRQDFLVLERPTGEGDLRLELAVEGASVERLPQGARLILEESGRRLAYTRLYVTDDTGRELPARMEVVTGDARPITLVVEDANAVYPIRIDPTFSDENWVSMGWTGGPNSGVSAAVVDSDGNLYIGGRFGVIGDLVVNHVAKWDGNAWSSLGKGVNGEVLALVFAHGSLYVGGRFTTAGDSPANRVARWDGSSWSSLGAGTNNHVLALAVAGDDLFVGGSFTAAGGAPASRVARWDGTAWSALGTGVNGTVTALVVAEQDLYAGGQFSTAGGAPANHVAKWDGASWSPLGDGMNFQVISLAVLESEVYAGGQFSTAGGLPISALARWDGLSWTALGDGLSGNVHSLASKGGDLYVGGNFSFSGGASVSGVARWDGHSWSRFGEGMNGIVLALALDEDRLFVGGNFTIAGDSPAHYVAEWSGSSWAPVKMVEATGVTGVVYAAALAADGSLYIGGAFESVGGVEASRVAKWDGSSWTALGDGLSGAVFALEFFEGDLYAGGSLNAAGGSPVSGIARWDGNMWLEVGGGVGGTVRALTASSESLFVGGQFTTAGGGPANRVAKWDGNAWSALREGVGGTVFALVVSGGELFAGGQFSTAGGAPANRVAKWDGSSWSPLGEGFNLTVRALAKSGEHLYAGGLFSQAEGQPANFVAKWNGTAWSSLGSGVSNFVYALAVNGEEVYAGGAFLNAGGLPANRFAKWTNGSWSAVGEGVNDTVEMLLAANGVMYVGGEFSVAGGKASTYLAKVLVGEAPGLSFPDAVLEAALRAELGIPEAALTEADLATLTSLDLSGLGITDLSGLEAAVNLVALDLRGNAFPSDDLLWGLLDQLVLHSLITDGPRPGGDPEGLSVFPLEDFDGLAIFVHVDPTEIASVDLSRLGFDPDTAGNAAILQAMVAAGVDPLGTRSFANWPVLAALPVEARNPLNRQGPLDLPNLLAFALGVDPMEATSADLLTLLDVDPTGGTGTLRYSRASLIEGTSLSLEVSATTGDWSDAIVLDTTVEPLSGGNRERVDAVIELPSGERVFFRLAVRGEPE
jgi:hypothetical protein